MINDDVERLIEVCQKCDSFFKGALDEAIKNQHIEISEEAASYLLWILLLGLRVDPYFNPETIIKRYLNAFTGKSQESFRDIGDSSLMIAGVWSESLTRKMVSVGYYIEMGQLAYQREAETNKRLGDLFEELSEKFLRSVNILVETIHLMFGKELTHKDILKTYQMWQETHSDFLERELRKLGINPVYLNPRKQ